jgi:hypothetical protein
MEKLVLGGCMVEGIRDGGNAEILRKGRNRYLNPE